MGEVKELRVQCHFNLLLSVDGSDVKYISDRRFAKNLSFFASTVIDLLRAGF